MKPLILHHGFDALDMSFKVTAPPDIIAKLAEAKAQAISSKSEYPIDLAGRQVLVSMSGGRGGYAYCINTGPLGGIWWFKEPNPRDLWGVRVSIHALPLALFGLSAVKRDIDDFFLSVGCVPQSADQTISRIDYAIDLLLPEFELNPKHLLTRARSTKAINFDKHAVGTSDRITGVTVGKMPGHQVIIYDKQKEAVDKRKPYWPLIWANNSGLDEELLKDVWRIEFRSGKQGIEKLIGKARWPLVLPQLSKVFLSIAKRIRLISPTDDTNRSRWSNEDIWNICVDILGAVDVDSASAFNPAEILELLRGEAIEQLVKQYFGIETSLAGALGYTCDDFETLIAKLHGLRRESLTRKRSELAAKIEAKSQIWHARYSLPGSGNGRP